MTKISAMKSRPIGAANFSIGDITTFKTDMGLSPEKLKDGKGASSKMPYRQHLCATYPPFLVYFSAFAACFAS
jgi:hypothetical protein